MPGEISPQELQNLLDGDTPFALIDVRERGQDWQLETRQTVGIGRQPDGVYTLVFGPTTLLLRPDAADDFIGYPYDSV